MPDAADLFREKLRAVPGVEIRVKTQPETLVIDTYMKDRNEAIESLIYQAEREVMAAFPEQRFDWRVTWKR